MKIILILILMIFISGCGRDFWFSSWDKAATERKQYEQLQKQNEYYERICEALEKIANK